LLHIAAADGASYFKAFTIFAGIAVIAPVLLILDRRTRSLTARD
jgi:hypothetical protein